MKEINLRRFLPVCAAMSVGLYLLTARQPYLLSLAVVVLATTFLGLQVRLGRLPWLEVRKDGDDKEP
jgi:hypothetical protein